MNTIGIVVIIGLVIALGLGGFAFYQTFNAEWVCIADECISYATGSEWISNNCRPKGTGENTSLFCDIEYGGTTYNVALSLVNLSHPAVRSCNEYVCSRQVFIK